MVSEGNLTPPSNTSSDDGEDYQQHQQDDTDSIASSQDEKQEYSGAVVLRDDAQQEVPSFGNISVMNSSDVHFGNKTFYQGPVTIKQFLYANNGQAKIDCDDSDIESSAIKDEIVLDAATVPKGFDNPGFTRDVQSSKNNSIPKDVTPETHSGVWKGFRWARKFSQEHFVVLVSFLALLMVSLGILMVVLLVKHPAVIEGKNSLVSKGDSDEQESNTPIEAPLDPTINLTLSGKLKLVSRLEWLAQPPVQPATPLTTPVPYVIISHTATENCSSQAQCVFQVRYIQTYHIESRHWWDIGYNFLVGGDGEAYVGRGWKSEGSHTYGYNSKSIGITFIGTFISFRPPERQIVACKQLIAKGIQLGYISQNYKLLAARQLQTTQSPGAFLYEDMKTWDHWAKEP